jgi:nucleotide-binding universal stress UspA family protein
MLFDRVLVPLDGTWSSEAVLSYLPSLLFPSESEIVLTHAVPFLETVFEMPAELGSGPPWGGADLSGAENLVERTIAHLRAQGFRARGLTQVGSTLELIEQVVRKERITLIALSHRPPSDFWHAVWNTLPKKLLRKTKIPLFIVNAWAPAPPGRPAIAWTPASKRILVPMGGNPATGKSVEMALHLARHFKATVALEALSNVSIFLGRTMISVESAIRRCESEGIPVQKVWGRGDPAKAILKEAEEGRADIIALSTHLIPFQVSTLGTIAARVLAHSTVPVLLTPKAEGPAPGDVPETTLPAEVVGLRPGVSPP